MTLLYDLRFVPAGLSVLATLLHAFDVLHKHRRVAQPLKACQLLRVKFRLELLFLSASQIILSLAVVVVFATLTVLVEINSWTIYLLGSVVACLWMSRMWPSVHGSLHLLRLAVGLPIALGSFFGGIIIADVYAYHGSTVMFVSAAAFRLWVACEWMVYSQKKHRTKGCVFMEAFLLSLMVLAGTMGMTCVKGWRLLPVLRLYMLLYANVPKLLAGTSIARNVAAGLTGVSPDSPSTMAPPDAESGLVTFSSPAIRFASRQSIDEMPVVAVEGDPIVAVIRHKFGVKIIYFTSRNVMLI
ncbi:uncharacterized protein PG986_014347 [Apiospora aurea]|uniref:Transmembrane protein n=1 Tax=Apiospora aurea TaxID=335848 RepID=A0ABR1PTQ9_9PEZI